MSARDGDDHHHANSSAIPTMNDRGACPRDEATTLPQCRWQTSNMPKLTNFVPCEVMGPLRQDFLQIASSHQAAGDGQPSQDDFSESTGHHKGCTFGGAQ